MKKFLWFSKSIVNLKLEPETWMFWVLGEKELEVRAMEGLSRNVSRRKQLKDDSSAFEVLPILKSEVQDAREL